MVSRSATAEDIANTLIAVVYFRNGEDRAIRGPDLTSAPMC